MKRFIFILTLFFFTQCSFAQSGGYFSVPPNVIKSRQEIYAITEEWCATQLAMPQHYYSACTSPYISSSWLTAGGGEAFMVSADLTSADSGVTRAVSLGEITLGCPTSMAIITKVSTPEEAQCTCASGQRFFSDVKNCVAVQQVPPPAPPKNKDCPACTKDGPPSIAVGDPVHIGTGNSFDKQIDFAVTTPRSGLTISRTYNSAPGDINDQDAVHSFGSHWMQPYDARILALDPVTATYKTSFQYPVVCWRRTDTGYIWCESSSTKVATIPHAVKVLRGNGKSYYFTLASNAIDNGALTWHSDSDVSSKLKSTVSDNGSTISGYTYTDTDNHTETFDQRGLLLKITALGGSTQQLTYSTGASNDSTVARYPATAPVCSNVQTGAIVAPNTLLCVTDHWGRQLQFNHDSQGRISAAIDPKGQITHYAYDGPSAGCATTDGVQNYACLANNLTSVTYPDGKTKTLYYNEAAKINGAAVCPGSLPVSADTSYLVNALTGIVDENGDRSVSWTFDCNGIATSSQRGGGVDTYQFSVGAPDANANSTSTLTTPLGTQLSYGFTSINGLLLGSSFNQPASNGSAAVTASSTYDANGNLRSYTDFNGNITHTTYDTQRNLALTRTEAVGTLQPRTVTTLWHPDWRLPTKVAEPLRLTEYTYDANGNVWMKTEHMTTDANGSQGISVKVTGFPRDWSYAYNSAGQVLVAKGPRRDAAEIVTNEYDDLGNLIKITDPSGQVTTLSQYDMNGHVGSINYPNGLTTSYTYSPRGWLTSQTKGTETTTFSYDGTGQLIGISVPNGASLTYTYDTAHRLTAIADNLGNTVHYTLDAMGNRIEEQITDTGGALVRQISQVVDALNRPQQITGE